MNSHLASQRKSCISCCLQLFTEVSGRPEVRHYGLSCIRTRRKKKNTAPYLTLHCVSCLHKSIIYTPPFHVALSSFFHQRFLKSCTIDKAMVLCALRNIIVAKAIVCSKWCLLTAADSCLTCRFLLKSTNWKTKQKTALFQQLESGSKHMKASNVACHQHRQTW